MKLYLIFLLWLGLQCKWNAQKRVRVHHYSIIKSDGLTITMIIKYILCAKTILNPKKTAAFLECCPISIPLLSRKVLLPSICLSLVVYWRFSSGWRIVHFSYVHNVGILVMNLLVFGSCRGINREFLLLLTVFFVAWFDFWSRVSFVFSILFALYTWRAYTVM